MNEILRETFQRFVLVVAIVFATGFPEAAVAGGTGIAYLSQERFVEAEANFRLAAYPYCEDDEGNEIDCPPNIDHQSFSAVDFGSFTAAVDVSQSGGEGYGAGASVEQTSLLLPDRIAATFSLIAQSNQGEHGSWRYDYGSSGSSTVSARFYLDEPSTARLRFDSAALAYGTYFDAYGGAYTRLKTASGETIFESNDYEPHNDRYNQQLDMSFLLDAGEYHFAMGVFGNAVPYVSGGPGQLDLEVSLTVEPIGVPEPSTLMLAAAASLALAVRRLRR